MSPLRIEGPPPVAPLYGLVTTPGVILNEEDEHWQGGVRVDSYPSDLPGLHDPCSTGTDREKDTGTEPPIPEFNSFTVYLPVTCSGIGIGNEAGATLLRNRARVVFQAVESFGVEEEFAKGLTDQDKPFLADDQADFLGGGQVGPREALALLELAIGATARQGFIHADAGVATMWLSYGLLEPAGAVMKTKRGNTVIIGDGYAGAQSAAVGAPALDGDWSYAFATGPVRVLRGDAVVLGPTREILDRANNLVSILVERTYVAYWDTALQAAVLVDRSLNP